jgi:feruloyl esterase
MSMRAVCFLILVALLAAVRPVAAQEPLSPGAACAALAGASFADIEDAPSQVIHAEATTSKPATGSPVQVCKVDGYVAPQVGFSLILPLSRQQWNHRFIELGCGGHCGTIAADMCAKPVSNGYACIVTDTGHQGTGGDGIWAKDNLQAKVDWGYRAPHVVAIAGKAITQRFYGVGAAHSYFMGCSTGGREALQEAQRFPYDFDGIIAGSPPIRLSDLYIMFAWGAHVGHASNGKAILSLQDLQLLNRAAVVACDRGDGLKDGIIGRPDACRFSPKELLCGRTRSKDCLTAAQVKAAESIYQGPSTSDGRVLFPGPYPGSEYNPDVTDPADGNWNASYISAQGYTPLMSEAFRYFYFDENPSPGWTYGNFRFDEDYKRMGVMEALVDSSNPDLSRFRDAGGKLLMYQGTNDNSVLPRFVIDYYQKVEAVMGGPKRAQEFARLFVLPGVEHCAGGVGAGTIDYISAMESWVERGLPPDKLIAYHLKDHGPPTMSSLWPEFPLNPQEIAFSRPVFPYPLQARYRGGNASEASSFGPAEN